MQKKLHPFFGLRTSEYTFNFILFIPEIFGGNINQSRTLSHSHNKIEFHPIDLSLVTPLVRLFHGFMVTSIATFLEESKTIMYLDKNDLPTFNFRQEMTRFIEKCSKFIYENGLLYLKKGDELLKVVCE